MNLDFIPSPEQERPGLLIRDPFRYSDTMLLIPVQLIECLECFDGTQTELDLRSRLVRMTGELEVGEIVRQLRDALSAAGFLHDENSFVLQEQRRRQFADSTLRSAAHCGSAYPDEPEPLRATMDRYLNGSVAPNPNLIGVAAPHVSPEGGWQSYRAAYQAVGPEMRDRTFVILGTSHYGEPERYGLTRKPFVTPYGTARTDTALVDWLVQRAPDSIQLEDYCHAVEHSIEFQVVFLQHLLGPDIRILPVLCGPFASSLREGGLPENDELVGAFLDALGELADRERERLFWVLGIDMAHMGRRYGDPFPAIANRGEMVETAARDRHRIDRVLAGDAAGFWSLVQENSDDLKWCGSSPLYTFLKAVPRAHGSLLRYEQWNIDPQSVVSFAGLSFSMQD